MDISFLLWLLFTLLSCSSSSDTCGDKSGSTLEIPLISTLNAPLVAQLDIWALTEQLKTLIKNEVRKSVSLAIQESVKTIIENKFSVAEEALQSRINSSLSDSIFELNREYKKSKHGQNAICALFNSINFLYIKKFPLWHVHQQNK